MGPQLDTSQRPAVVHRPVARPTCSLEFMLLTVARLLGVVLEHVPPPLVVLPPPLVGKTPLSLLIWGGGGGRGSQSESAVAVPTRCTVKRRFEMKRRRNVPSMQKHLVLVCCGWCVSGSGEGVKGLIVSPRE